MQNDTFHTGKIPLEFLQVLLERYGGRDERIVVGPGIGEDALVLDMGTRYLVAKTDPITFATDEIGWYVVHVNANDIAAMGATPRWLLLTLLLPEDSVGRAGVDEIFAQVARACQALGIALAGGHTEITYGLDRPIAVGLMLGEVEKEDLVCTGGAQVGDDILLTKGIAIEGTAVMARDIGSRLANEVGTELVARGRRFLRDPGISVVRDAQIVCGIGKPHAMHDPTEGGLATGLWEMAYASGRRLVVDREQVHVHPETAHFCQALNLDPLGVIASGALLVCAAPQDTGPMVDALTSAGIQATIIGRVVEGPADVQMRTADGTVPFPSFARDELLRLFD
jgi:hydrogenase maturation factor